MSSGRGGRQSDVISAALRGASRLIRGVIERNQTPSAWRTAFADVGGVAVGELREIRFERRSRDASRISPLMKRQPEEDVLAHLMREAIRGHHPRSSSEVIIRGHHQRCSRAPTRASKRAVGTRTRGCPRDTRGRGRGGVRPRARRGACSYLRQLGRQSEAIRGHQRSSEAIRGHQRPSEGIRGH